MKVCIGVAIGIGKKECEDFAFCNKFLLNNELREYNCLDLKCVGVADGVGGNAGGKIASGYVASQITHPDFSKMDEIRIVQFIEELNHRLIQYASSIPEKAEAATTLTCLVVGSDCVYLIHVGNTRLYVKQGSYLKQLTNDQTTYNWLLECGQYEAAERCNKNEINGCLGGGNPQYSSRVVVEKIFEKDLPDLILLTSDGIHEYVDLDVMENVLSSELTDQKMIQLLIEKAVSNGSTDDKTVIMVRR